MEDTVYYLIAGLIVNVTIACINEFMPLSTPIQICGVTVQGEKGVISSALVWLGLKKSRVEAGNVLQGTAKP